jgi:hypothetical protein
MAEQKFEATIEWIADLKFRRFRQSRASGQQTSREPAAERRIPQKIDRSAAPGNMRPEIPEPVLL